MNERSRKCLVDIQEAGRAILAFSADLTFEDFTADDRTRSAVERKFEIIGEALRRLRDEDPLTFPNLSSGNEIIGMRNRLIHGYDAVDEEIVWETIHQYLPTLLEEISQEMDKA